MFNDLQMNAEQLKVAETLPVKSEAKSEENNAHGPGDDTTRSNNNNRGRGGTQGRRRHPANVNDIRVPTNIDDVDRFLAKFVRAGLCKPDALNRGAEYRRNMYRSIRAGLDPDPSMREAALSFVQTSTSIRNGKMRGNFISAVQAASRLAETDQEASRVLIYEESDAAGSPGADVILEVDRDGNNVNATPNVEPDEEGHDDNPLTQSQLATSQVVSPSSIPPDDPPPENQHELRSAVNPRQTIARAEGKRATSASKKADAKPAEVKPPEEHEPDDEKYVAEMISRLPSPIAEMKEYEKRNFVRNLASKMKDITNHLGFHKFRTLWNSKFKDLFKLEIK